jgi:hypothetical protein
MCGNLEDEDFPVAGEEGRPGRMAAGCLTGCPKDAKAPWSIGMTRFSYRASRSGIEERAGGRRSRERMPDAARRRACQTMPITTDAFGRCVPGRHRKDWPASPSRGRGRPRPSLPEALGQRCRAPSRRRIRGRKREAWEDSAFRQAPIRCEDTAIPGGYADRARRRTRERRPHKRFE